MMINVKFKITIRFFAGNLEFYSLFYLAFYNAIFQTYIYLTYLSHSRIMYSLLFIPLSHTHYGSHILHYKGQE